MTSHEPGNDHSTRYPAADAPRRKFLRVGAVSAAAVAALLASRESPATSRDGGINQSELSDHIRELKAREEIKELRAKYCWYATRADAKSYRELFTSDCVFEYRRAGKRQVFEGRDAISAIVADISPGTVTPIVGNHTIVLDGNEASGTCAARNTIRGEDGESVTVTGFYHDKFQCENGRWRFSERRWFTYSPEYEDNEVPMV